MAGSESKILVKSSTSQSSSAAFATELASGADGVESSPASTMHERLTADDLAVLKDRFTSGKMTNVASGFNKARLAGLVGEDSFEAASSLLSVTSASVAQASGELDTAAAAANAGKSFTIDQTGSARPSDAMNVEEWVSALTAVKGTEKVAEEAAAMFRHMDSTRKMGYVTWGTVLDFLIGKMSPSSLHNEVSHLSHDGRFKNIQHSKRETIQKIVGVSTGSIYVYIIVSRFGHVGIYDDKFRLQRKYDVDIDTDPNADLDVAASDPGWITDAVWMDNSKHAVYTTSLRTMHFFDASASVHYEEYRAFGFKSIPTCVDYAFDEDNPENESLLLFGDDAGGLTCVTFSQPLNSLFAKDEVDNVSVQCIFWPDMAKHEEFAAVAYYPAVHKDGVQGLKYLASNKTVITVSRDPNVSVSIRHIHGKFDAYIFRLNWGVRCFDYGLADSFHLLATGSNDKIVRLWNPVMTSRPTAVLTGHRSGINDVRIHMSRRLIISYDKGATLKVWDMDNGGCFQTLNLAFPSFELLGKEIDYGRPALYIETASPTTIIATCCEQMAIVTLVESGSGHSRAKAVPEHKISPPDDQPEEQVKQANGEKERKTKDDDEDEDDIERSASRGSIDESRQLSARGDYDRSRLASPVAVREAASPIGSDYSVGSSAAGWASVHGTIKGRTVGKAFQQHSLEEDADYSFRLFTERLDGSECADDSAVESLNVLRVRKYMSNKRLKDLARDNMPFMGLEIHGLQEVSLQSDLPHTSSMLAKGVRIRNVDDLVAARFDLLGMGAAIAPPAAEGADGAAMEAAEAGSSTTGSRRSSVVGRKAQHAVSAVSTALAGHKTSIADLGALPMISEKSDSPSILTEASFKS